MDILEATLRLSQAATIGEALLTLVRPHASSDEAYASFVDTLAEAVERSKHGSQGRNSERRVGSQLVRLVELAETLSRSPRFEMVRRTHIKGVSISGSLNSFNRAIQHARDAYLFEPALVPAPQIPAQEAPSPFEFVVEDRLDVVRQVATPLLDEQHIRAAKEFLLESAMRHLNGLTNSPQIQAELRILVERLKSDGNVVALGMAAEAFARVVKASEDELGASRVGALHGFAEEVARFASQFSEWQQYVENSARTRYGDEEIEQAVSALRDLASKLDVTMASPHAIEAIKDASQFNPKSGKGKAGIVNTLKNFVVAVGRRVADLTADKVLEGGVARLAILALTLLGTPILQAMPWAAPLFDFLKQFFG